MVLIPLLHGRLAPYRTALLIQGILPQKPRSIPASQRRVLAVGAVKAPPFATVVFGGRVDPLPWFQGMETEWKT